jgi:hypothetical protein
VSRAGRNVRPTVSLVTPLFGEARVERTKIDHGSLVGSAAHALLKSGSPSIAVIGEQRSERREGPKAEVRPELQNVSSGGANSTRAALPESSENHYRMP